MKKKQKNRWHSFDDDRIEEYWEEEGLLDDDREFGDDEEDDELLEFDEEFELIEGPTDEAPLPEWKQGRRNSSD
jgi:hypothetical protein